MISQLEIDTYGILDPPQQNVCSFQVHTGASQASVHVRYTLSFINAIEFNHTAYALSPRWN